jgi:predicted permease
MWSDVRFALRTLRRSPVFTIIAVLSLALGIGANTAIFSLLDQVLLRGLPVREPQRLVVFHVAEHFPGWSTADNRESVFSFPMYKDLRDRSRVFDGVMARAGAPVSVSDGGATERAGAEIVSGNYFQALAVMPLLGRNIVPEDDGAPGAHPVVMLSYGYWVRRFGASPAVLNRKITVNGNPLVVIGVGPPGFHGVIGGQTPDLFVPIAMQRQISPTWDALEDCQIAWLSVFARLKPGVSVAQAQAGMQTVFRPMLEELLARTGRMRSRKAEEELLAMKLSLLEAVQGINEMRRQFQKPLAALMGMVGLVLLIACANVAGLLIARAAGRRKEIAIRLALGAGRKGIMRQLLVESLVLGLAGGVAGLLVGRWTDLGLLRLLAEGGPEGWLSASLDLRVLGFSLLLSVVTGILFGLAPALQSMRAEVASALKDQSASVRSGAGGAQFRRALVVAQVALSLLLLVGAGLFARSVSNLMRVDPGFRSSNVLTFAIDPTSAGYPGARATALYRELQQRLEALPGVEAAGAANPGPLTHSGRGGNITVEGYQAKGDEEVGASQHAVSAGYFRALGVPVVAGREFADRDLAGSQKLAVVNEAFVKRYFRDRNPLGRRLACMAGNKVVPDREIVGVVRDFKHGNLREQAVETVFFPYTQDERPNPLTFYVRAERGESQLASDIRRMVREMDANLPVFAVRPLTVWVQESILTDRLIAILSSAFGALATLLAAVGLYGVIAYTVARRTAEIGVRMALGALPRGVLALVMREVGVLVLAGIAIGLPAALAASRLVESQLFGIKANDPMVFALATLGLCAVGLLAGLIPARRAAAIDPIRALRYE